MFQKTLRCSLLSPAVYTSEITKKTKSTKPFHGQSVLSILTTFVKTSTAAIWIALLFLALRPTQGLAAPVAQTAGLPPVLVLTNTVEPDTDTGLFNLYVDNQIVALNIGDGGTTGPIMLEGDGPHTIRVEAGSGNSLDLYQTTVDCVTEDNVTLVSQLAASAELTPSDEDSKIECVFQHKRLPVLTASLNDTLVIDADVATEPGASPGDTIELQLKINNQIGITATEVSLVLPIDTNTTLISDSITTTQGTISVTHGLFTPTVSIALGDLPVGQPVTASLQVMVKNPLPSNVDTVVFQGTVESEEAADVLTDDPSIPAIADPTEISVTAKPLLKATHVDLLLVDSDGNQKVSGGDRLFYEVTVFNIGNGAALNLDLFGSIDAHTTLVLESLFATQGTITTNSTDSGTEIKLSAGTLNGGGATVKLQYQVEVHKNITASAISSQFEATALQPNDPSSVIRVLSDDPATLINGDPTTASVLAVSFSGGLYLPVVTSPSIVR